MKFILILYTLILIKFKTISCDSVQLTFELPDKERQCFYEHIDKDVTTIVEYQVVTGGNYDVDMIMKAPNGKIIYQEQRKQYDSFNYKAEIQGNYEVCFSNEFSTFTHKIVYVDWQVGEESPIMAPGSPVRAMTFLETSAQNIHDKLNQIVDDQTHYRIREYQGREHAEELHEKVNIWSISQMGVIILVGLFQIYIIRSFFSSRK